MRDGENREWRGDACAAEKTVCVAGRRVRGKEVRARKGGSIVGKRFEGNGVGLTSWGHARAESLASGGRKRRRSEKGRIPARPREVVA